MKPVALDLCCGKGGWAHGFIAEGWRVVGVDLHDFAADYPGEFIRADLLTWEGWRDIPARVVVASPPCEEFSRWGMPWTRARNPPEPSLALVNRCRQIAADKSLPIILENVRAAQNWLGRSAGNCGAFHLWGDVPIILPVFAARKKESLSSRRRAERAVVPLDLARHVARCYR